jgi:hypothetical protein
MDMYETNFRLDFISCLDWRHARHDSECMPQEQTISLFTRL